MHGAIMQVVARRRIRGTSWRSCYCRLGRGAKLLTGLAALVALAGCAGARVPPIGADGRPFAPEPDERELWDAAGREAEAIARAGKPRAAPDVEAYLTAIAGRLMPPAARSAGGPVPSATVLMDPAVSAFSLPTGRIYVHSGLLARAGSEARLAAILAREVAHVILRHALTLSRDGRPLASGPSARAPGAALAGLPLARAGAVDGYGGDREREADAEALRALARAGYDPREAPRAFDALREDEAIERDEPHRDAPYALGRAAWLAERARSLRKLLDRGPAAAPAEGAGADPGAFGRVVLPVLRDNARLEARAGRVRAARAQIDRVLAAAPNDAVAHLADGELLRLQAQRAGSGEAAPALLARARGAFERAAELEPASPEPYRALAMLAYQAGDTAAARAAFERYLAIHPDAPDARRIREYLEELAPR